MIKKRSTIYDVARDSGVSIATVSRHLKGLTVIAPETQKKIEKSIKKLSYRPSILATSLAKKTKCSVGLIVPCGERAYKDLFLSEVLSGVCDSAGKAGFLVQLTMLNPELDTKKMLQHHIDLVDGSLILDEALDNSYVKELIHSGHKVIAVNRIHKNIPWVAVDNAVGALQAIRYLFSKGHRIIAGIGEKKGISEIRFNGFATAFKECGIEKHLLLDTAMNRNRTYKAVKRLLTSNEAPTGIALASDWIASAAITAANELGFKIPEQLAIIGFDDSILAESTVPSLTTIKQPLYQMGSKAFELFEAVITNKKGIKNQILLEPELVIRESA